MACTSVFQSIDNRVNSAALLIEKKYLTKNSSRLFDIGNAVAECIDYLLCTIASVGHLVSSVFKAKGQKAPEAASEIENKANTGRMMVGALRTFQSLETLITLKWLFKRDSQGKLIKEKGAPQKRHPLSIATMLSLIAGRILGFITTLHNLLVYNLGKHAKQISHAVTGCYTALVTFGLADAMRSYWKANPSNSEEMQDATVDLIQNSAYVVMHPFECGVGMSATAHPALGIVGSVVSIVGSIAIIWMHLFQAKGFRIDPETMG